MKNRNLTGGLFDGRGKPQTLRVAAKALVDNTPEKIIQSSFFYHLKNYEKEFPFLKWFHSIPNGGLRSKAVAVQMKREGVKSGVCDTFLPMARQTFNGLYIEFKTATGRTSPEQKEFIEFVKGENYKAEICRTTKEAVEILNDYLGINLPTKYLR